MVKSGNVIPQVCHAHSTRVYSKGQADEKALAEYTEFRIVQDRNYIGDFEKMMQQIEKAKK